MLDNPTPPHPNLNLKGFAVVDSGFDMVAMRFTKRFTSRFFDTSEEAQAFFDSLPGSVKPDVMVMPVFR